MTTKEVSYYISKNMITKQNLEERASTKVSYYIILLFVFGPGKFDAMRVLDDVIAIHSKIMYESSILGVKGS